MLRQTNQRVLSPSFETLALKWFDRLRSPSIARTPRAVAAPMFFMFFFFYVFCCGLVDQVVHALHPGTNGGNCGPCVGVPWNQTCNLGTSCTEITSNIKKHRFNYFWQIWKATYSFLNFSSWPACLSVCPFLGGRSQFVCLMLFFWHHSVLLWWICVLAVILTPALHT